MFGVRFCRGFGNGSPCGSQSVRRFEICCEHFALLPRKFSAERSVAKVIHRKAAAEIYMRMFYSGFFINSDKVRKQYRESFGINFVFRVLRTDVQMNSGEVEFGRVLVFAKSGESFV